MARAGNLEIGRLHARSDAQREIGGLMPVAHSPKDVEG
jgi:hypothetical protein